jgi:hypothetical protein
LLISALRKLYLFKRPVSHRGKPDNNKENSMNKKHGLFCGFAVIALAAIFTFAGCGDEGDPTSPSGGIGGYTGPSGTIKMEETTTNEFTLTLTGLTWVDQAALDTNDDGYSIGDYLSTYLALDGAVTATGADSANEAISSSHNIRYTVTRTSDTVVTVTMSKLGFSGGSYFGDGSLKLADFSKNTNGFDPGGGFDRGAALMYNYTEEGKAYSGASNNMNGKLTVASDSASVDFSLAK